MYQPLTIFITLNLQCAEGLICFQRDGGGVPVPGCEGGDKDLSRTDYCIKDQTTIPTTVSTDSPKSNPPTPMPSMVASGTYSPTFGPTKMPYLVSFGGTPPDIAVPLSVCTGDCDMDSQV